MIPNRLLFLETGDCIITGKECKEALSGLSFFTNKVP
jgi:hypothetical protein